MGIWPRAQQGLCRRSARADAGSDCKRERRRSAAASAGPGEGWLRLACWGGLLMPTAGLRCEVLVRMQVSKRKPPCRCEVALGAGSCPGGKLAREALLTPPPPVCPRSLSRSLALDRLLRPNWAPKDKPSAVAVRAVPAESAHSRPPGSHLNFAESEMVRSLFLSRSAWHRSTQRRSPAPPSAGQALKGRTLGFSALSGARCRTPRCWAGSGCPFFL